MMGYARLLAARGEPASALALLQELARTAPTPDLAARTGDLLAQLGRRDEAERQYALAEAGWRVDAPEPKNLARFLADHDRKIPEAVAIAEQFAMLGAVDEAPVELGGDPATVLTLIRLKPGVSRSDVVVLAQQLGLNDVILY